MGVGRECSPVLEVPDEGNDAFWFEDPGELDGRLVVVRAPMVGLQQDRVSREWDRPAMMEDVGRRVD